MKWADRVGRRVKLRDLHILLAVAQRGSMTKAAEYLSVSYPVVSKTVSELERTLGVRLFDRSIRGVETTPQGRALLNCGVAVFDELRQGLKQIEFLNDPTSGELRIGCSEPMAAGLLPAIAQKFSQQYPRVVLHVMHSNLAELQFADLRNRDVELVLGRIQTPFVGDDLVAETLLDEPLLLSAGINSKWSRRRHIELAELIDEPWILSPPESLPGLLQAEVFRASGLGVPRPSIVTLSVQLFSIMLATGRYVALLPGSIMRSGAHRSSLKILPAKLPARPRPVGIVVVKDRTRSPLAERFIECARAVTKGFTKLH